MGGLGALQSRSWTNKRPVSRRRTGYRRFYSHVHGSSTFPLYRCSVALHTKIDPLKSQDPHTIVGSRLICSSRSRLAVIAMAHKHSAALITRLLVENDSERGSCRQRIGHSYIYNQC